MVREKQGYGGRKEGDVVVFPVLISGIMPTRLLPVFGSYCVSLFACCYFRIVIPFLVQELRKI